MDMLLIMVVFIGLMYVLMVLPQKRKMDAQRKLLESLEPGARVLLNTGMFGTIRATGNQQMVVELAPGVEVTVLRQAVMRQVTPSEEEFEYSDEADQLEAGAVDDSFVADAEPVWDQPEQPLEAPVDFAAPAVEQTSTSQDSETNFYGQAVPEDETDRPQGR